MTPHNEDSLYTSRRPDFAIRCHNLYSSYSLLFFKHAHDHTLVSPSIEVHTHCMAIGGAGARLQCQIL